jgi:hypothetical protein
MAYSIANVKTDLEGILKGTSTNKVKNLNEVFWRAARQMLLDCDPQETKRKAQIASAIFDSVYDYTAPVDLKGNKIIDIRPQTGRTQKDNFSQRLSEDFDLTKSSTNNTFQTEYNNGVKTIRINKNVGTATTLNGCSSLTGNGTWVAGDDTTNITLDSLTFVTNGGSINFDVDGSTTIASISNATMTAIDLSDHEELSTVFGWLYFPSAAAVTSVELRWGNDASNYWKQTVTDAFSGAFQDGWNQLGFAWNGATETGTVDPEVIDYLEVIITYDGVADTDFRIDSFASSMGQIFDVLYYSKYLFSDNTGVWKETVSADTDTINLDTESYNLYLFKVAEMCAQQIEQIKDDASFFKGEYSRTLRRYTRMYRSEVEKPRASYYTI